MVVDLAGQIRIIFVGRFQNNLRRQPHYLPLTFLLTYFGPIRELMVC